MAKAKEIQGLDCEGEALPNIKLILRVRLEEITSLREKALDWSDIKGVHDMRVASRRLRSALRYFAPYVNEKKALRRSLRELAASLGAVRDEDVAILALEKLRPNDKPDIARGIDLLIEERRERQAVAREHLKTSISTQALAHLQEKFIAWLEEATVNGKHSAGSSKLKFKRAGQETILSQYRELYKLSSSLFRPFDVEPLHLMRIAAKRLRYAIELFSRCFGEEMAAFAEEISELQTALGDLHDCDVWITDLGARLATRDDEGYKDKAIADNLEALKRRAAFWLLQYFIKERMRYFSNALALWSRWETTDFYSRLHASLQCGALRPSLIYNQIAQ